MHGQGVGCTPRCPSGVPGSPPLLRGIVHCQGVGCTRRCPSGVPGSPPLLRGRRGTLCTAKGSDVRPGVPLASLGLRFFCVAGVGQCALLVAFAWQAWDNVHCQGVGCSASLGLRFFCVAGMGQCAWPRGRMYAPVFLWRSWGVGGVGLGAPTHSLSHSRTLTLSLTHSFAHSLTHSLTHSTPRHFTPVHSTSLHSTPLTLTD